MLSSIWSIVHFRKKDCRQKFSSTCRPSSYFCWKQLEKRYIKDITMMPCNSRFSPLLLVGCFLFATSFLSADVDAFQPALSPRLVGRSSSSSSSSTSLHVFAPDKEKTQPKNVEETTEKYGLEVGLFESMKQKDGGESAKSLLKKYGIAYLATSIPLAALSFAICYVLVSNGVDVGALLGKVGIESSGTTETAGTFAIAYAAHKAASPIRFPPTVALTPIVAKLIGKEAEVETENDEQQAQP